MGRHFDEFVVMLFEAGEKCDFVMEARLSEFASPASAFINHSPSTEDGTIRVSSLAYDIDEKSFPELMQSRSHRPHHRQLPPSYLPHPPSAEASIPHSRLAERPWRTTKTMV